MKIPDYEARSHVTRATPDMDSPAALRALRLGLRSRFSWRGSTAAPAIGAALVVIGWGAIANAEDAGARGGAKHGVTVVTVSEGPGSDAVASALLNKLPAPYSQGDSASFRGAVGPGAVRTAFIEAAVKRKDKDADFVSRMRVTAKRVHVDRVLVVRTEKGKNKEGVHLWMIDAQGSGPAEFDEEVHVASSASSDDEASAAWSAVESNFVADVAGSGPRPQTSDPASASTASVSAPSGASASGSSPSASAPTAAPSAGASSSADASATTGSAAPQGSDSTPSAGSSGDRTRAHNFASLGLDVVGGSRHFSYVDRRTATLRPYDLFVAPAIQVSGDIYPLNKMRIPVLSGLGLQGAYSRAFGLSSQDASGNTVGTSWQSYELGLRDRIAIGDSFLLGVGGGYGDDNFSFDGAVTPTEQLPSVDYQYLRAGVDGRYFLGDLSVRAALGYRGVLSTGQVGKLFPRASAGGVDASLGLSRMMAPGIELSLDLQYARFYYSLLPQPGDTYVAGGALDEMASLSLGLTYLL
jgi:hypothetical protein